LYVVDVTCVVLIGEGGREKKGGRGKKKNVEKNFHRTGTLVVML